uniref:hypothetical protein n=1 Tax=Amycolatopsis sp. CA-096443 TaxID=3239919 RepID=UPI003F49236E
MSDQPLAERQRSPESRALRNLCIAMTAACLFAAVAIRYTVVKQLGPLDHAVPAWAIAFIKASPVGFLVLALSVWMVYVPFKRSLDAEHARPRSAPADDPRDAPTG